MAAKQMISLVKNTSTSIFVTLEYNDAYSNLSKSTLVQESNIFNEKNLSVLKCVDLLNKITFLLN
jgi:hypothetical protein